MTNSEFSRFGGGPDSGATSGGLGVWLRRAVVIVPSVLCVALLIAVAVLATHKGASPATSSPSSTQCTSSACMVYAGSARRHMNVSVRPCDDFYQYACGGYSSANPVHPQDDDRSVTIDVLRKNERALHVELWKDVKRVGTLSWERKLKYYFRSCMDEFSVQEQGGRPLVEAVRASGGWCVLQPGQPAPGATWADYAKQLKTISVKYRSWPFFRVEVIETPDNSQTHMVKLLMDGLSMDPLQYIGKTELVQMSYMTYLRSVGMLVARDAGLNLTDPTTNVAYSVDRFAEEVYDFEKDIANATLEAKKDSGDGINQIMTLGNLKVVSSQINYKDILASMFPEVTFTDDTTVMLDYTPYYGQVDKLIRSTLRKRSAGVRVLNNYLVWRLMQSFVRVLSADYRSTVADMRVAIEGKPETKSRWELCFNEMAEKMTLALNALYVGTLTDADTFKQVKDDIYPAMMAAFDKQVSGLRWMDDKTKQAGRQKVSKMKRFIGADDNAIRDTAVDTEYKQLTIQPSRLAENTVSWWEYKRRADGARLASPANKPDSTDQAKLWDPHFAFNQRWNTLLVPAGLMQMPLVDSKLPMPVNLGSVGAAMGSAALGAVDIIGGHYTADGRVTHWWSPDTLHVYLGRWACFIDFWNNTETGPWNVDGTSKSVMANARKVARFSMADIGGVRQAYLAYKDWTAKHGSAKVMAGLDNVSGDKQFFQAFAQTHCFNQRQKAGYEMARNGYVPPNIRINKALMQFPEFQKAYNCPANSPMVAKKICEGY